MPTSDEMPPADPNIIDDEILRSRIRKIIDEPKLKPTWERITTNPLTSILIGFILTGIIGVILTNHYNQKQRELELARTEQQKELDRQRDDQQRELERTRNEYQKELEYERNKRLREMELARSERQRELEFERNKQQRALEYERDKRQQEFQRQQDEEKAHYEASAKAIQDFSRLVYERYTRSMMLYSSFQRTAPIEEIRERKKDYDRVFVDWNTNLKANLFIIRNAVKEPIYSHFEGFVEFGLVDVFKRIDRCLTQAYDNRLQEKPFHFVLDDCRMPEELNLAIDCSYAVTDELFRFLAFERLVSGTKRENLEQRAIDVIQRRCGQ